MNWLWWAPLVAATLHVFEEFVLPGGFADWDRSYRPAVAASITPRFHVFINAAMLLACLQVGFLAGAEGVGGAGRVAAAAWLALAALLFSNAVFHAVGTLATRTYSPGLVTAAFLYVPMTFVGYAHFLSSGRASVVTACIAAAVGGSYHLWARVLHRLRAAGKGRVTG